MKFIDHIEPEKMDRIWDKTKTYPTKDSSITTIYDLLVGLHNFGYPNWANFLLEGPEFTVIKKKDLHRALKNILFISNDVIYSLADLDSHYGGGRLGYSSFAALTSDDLISNSGILHVLLREVLRDYPGSRITEFGSGFVLDYNKHLGRKGSYGYDECLEMSHYIADRLVKKSETKYGDENEFGWWGKSNNNLYLEHSDDYLYVSGKPLYRVGCIGFSELRLKELEGRKSHFNLDAIKADYKKMISKPRSDVYFPCFTCYDDSESLPSISAN